MEEIISQQISAAIEALNRARAGLASNEADSYLDTAASFIHDIQFNVMSMKSTQEC